MNDKEVKDAFEQLDRLRVFLREYILRGIPVPRDVQEKIIKPLDDFDSIEPSVRVDLVRQKNILFGILDTYNLTDLLTRPRASLTADERLKVEQIVDFLVQRLDAASILINSPRGPPPKGILKTIKTKASSPRLPEESKPMEGEKVSAQPSPATTGSQVTQGKPLQSPAKETDSVKPKQNLESALMTTPVQQRSKFPISVSNGTASAPQIKSKSDQQKLPTSTTSGGRTKDPIFQHPSSLPRIPLEGKRLHVMTQEKKGGEEGISPAKKSKVSDDPLVKSPALQDFSQDANMDKKLQALNKRMCGTSLKFLDVKVSGKPGMDAKEAQVQPHVMKTSPSQRGF